LIAALTFAANSGVTSVMPWSCAACAATCFNNSSSVDALAVKLQSGTISAHAMYLAFWFSGAGIVNLLSMIVCSHLEMPGGGSV
jgi:hypothetical protein